MFISADTLDDLMNVVLRKLLREKRYLTATKGKMTELTGVLLQLRNPAARLSRTETKGTVFSCIGETLWYLAGTNRLDFIEYYRSKRRHRAGRVGRADCGKLPNVSLAFLSRSQISRSSFVSNANSNVITLMS